MDFFFSLACLLSLLPFFPDLQELPEQLQPHLRHWDRFGGNGISIPQNFWLVIILRIDGHKYV